MMLFSFLLLLAVNVPSIVSAIPFMANTDSEVARSIGILHIRDENPPEKRSDVVENISDPLLGPILTSIFSIGGGLFNGILQPFTGILATLEGLAAVPICTEIEAYLDSPRSTTRVIDGNSWRLSKSSVSSSKPHGCAWTLSRYREQHPYNISRARFDSLKD